MSWLSKITGGGDKLAQAARADGGPRPSAPPKIVIDHHEYAPEEFVFGSFRIRPYDGDLIAKQQFDFRLVLPGGEEPVEFGCRGIVIKQNPETGLVARYSRPQPFYEKKLIEYLRAWKGV